MSKEGEEREDHKYVARILNPKGMKNKYRYFYTQAEWSSYLKEQKSNNLPSQVQFKTSSSTTTTSKPQTVVVNGFVDNVKKFLKEKFNIGPPEIPEAFNKLSRIEHPDSYSNDEHQVLINPLFFQSIVSHSTKYTMNCASCSAAYDLRKRGYDVVAAPRKDWESMGDNVPGLPSVDNMINHWYEPKPKFVEGDLEPDPNNSMITSIKNINHHVQEIEKLIEPIPEGSFGIISVAWRAGSAHGMAWEKENGKLVIRDCQTNEIRDLEELLKISSYYNIMRTDNVTPTEVVLSHVVDKKEFDERQKKVAEQKRADAKPLETKLEQLKEERELLEYKIRDCESRISSPAFTEAAKSRAGADLIYLKAKLDICNNDYDDTFKAIQRIWNTLYE